MLWIYGVATSYHKYYSSKLLDYNNATRKSSYLFMLQTTTALHTRNDKINHNKMSTTCAPVMKNGHVTGI